MNTVKGAATFGVILMDMGGPADIFGVEAYIAAMLGDRDVVQMPLGWLYQKPLARFIARKRAPKVEGRYKLIGGGSPIVGHTRDLAKAVKDIVRHPVSIAMRYTAPFAAQAIDELRVQGVNHILVVPLFPHLSGVSTVSALKAIEKAMPEGMEWDAIHDHHDDPGYIASVARGTETLLEEVTDTSSAHIMFAAHSIPESYTRRGDPYIAQIETTARLVHEHLETEVPYTVAYQSAVGPVKWHRPDVEEELQRLKIAGISDLVVVPLSFVSENLETLYDLDIVLKRACDNAGVNMLRVLATGLLPGYSEALAHLINTAIETWELPDA